MKHLERKDVIASIRAVLLVSSLLLFFLSNSYKVKALPCCDGATSYYGYGWPECSNGGCTYVTWTGCYNDNGLLCDNTSNSSCDAWQNFICSLPPAA